MSCEAFLEDDFSFELKEGTNTIVFYRLRESQFAVAADVETVGFTLVCACSSTGMGAAAQDGGFTCCQGQGCQAGGDNRSLTCPPASPAMGREGKQAPPKREGNPHLTMVDPPACALPGVPNHSQEADRG